MLAEHVARELAAEVAPQPQLVRVVAVAAVEVEGDPADAALRVGHLEAGIGPQGRPPQQVLGGQRRDLAGEDHAVVDGGAGRVGDGHEADADVQAHDQTGVGQRLEDGAPVVEVVVAGEALDVGQFAHRYRLGALVGHPADLGDGQRRVPRRDDRQRDEPARVRPGPVFEVPVVVRLDHRHGHLVLEVVEVAGAEAGEGGEAHRGGDAVAVHVRARGRGRRRRPGASRDSRWGPCPTRPWATTPRR